MTRVVFLCLLGVVLSLFRYLSLSRFQLSFISLIASWAVSGGRYLNMVIVLSNSLMGFSWRLALP